jgi:hypothetical protein
MSEAITFHTAFEAVSSRISHSVCWVPRMPPSGTVWVSVLLASR